MSSKLLKNQKKNRAALAFATVGAVSAIGAMTVTASADTTGGLSLEKGVTAGSFDLTKQASGTLKFPVQFDRPSGVNAAALAGTVRQLGTGSTLYKSALAAVPDLADSTKMNSLLSDALDSKSANYASARANIVKLINWYNSLGGQKITTQAGATYTADNLGEPINVLAVAFSNNNSINASATTTLASINDAKTVGDVMTALNDHKSGVSQPYESAFSAYAQKVYADGADLNALSTYTQLKPVLDSYESMYANGAAAIRTTLLNGSATSTEAGVTFFESAVIAGSTSNGGGDDSSSNKPSEDVEYTTKWVDESGKALDTPVTNKTGYEAQKTFDGYEYVSVSTDDATHTKTYVYKPKTPTPTPTVTEDTKWVDEDGKALKPQESGTKLDDGKTTLFPGYTLVSAKTTTDADGNKHTVNTYKKDPENKTHTTWVDKDGNTLKPQQDGNHPDTEGDDVPGYKLVGTTTDKDGNTINTYEKTPTQATVDTYWFDTDGNTLKDKVVGTFPDNDGNDIAGYTIEQVYTVKAADIAKGGVFENAGFKVGDTINIYKKTAAKDPSTDGNTNTTKVKTTWVDENGKELQPSKDGSFPDNDGVSDIKGYTLVSTEVDPDGNVKNVYKKNTAEVTTSWVDESYNPLTGDVTGAAFGDKKDFSGYKLKEVRMSADGKHKYYIYEKVAATADPTTPAATTPTQTASSAKNIPQTGLDMSSSTTLSALGISLMTALGLTGLFKRFRRKQQTDDK